VSTPACRGPAPPRLLRHRGPRCLRCGAFGTYTGGGGGGSAVVVSVAGGRDDVGEVDTPDALSLSVVRPRRTLLRGVTPKVLSPARGPPSLLSLVPADAREPRRIDVLHTALHRINAVLEKSLVPLRRGLLSSTSQLNVIAFCGTGDALRCRLGGVWGISGMVGDSEGVFCVRNGSGELKSGRVYALPLYSSLLRAGAYIRLPISST